MARKRLGPAFGAAFDPRNDPRNDPGPAPLEAKGMFPLGVARHAPPASAPIARVSGEIAAHAAAEALAEDLRVARESGRLVLSLPLSEVAEGWLVRDRLLADPEDLETLRRSIRDRGQQTPVEVVDLGAGAQPRYGLVSGWRRLTALRGLAAEDPRFGVVAALLRRPETTADAYRAMVEENEIRVGLSYYERARIVAEAAGKRVYPGRAEALAGLFAAASRAKRSKIGSFVKIHDALGDRLRFAPAIPERLGLQLARALEADADLGPRLRERLRKGAPDSAEAELALLARGLAPPSPARAPSPAPQPAPHPSDQGAPAEIELAREGTRLVLSGAGVTPELEASLRAWLAGRA